MEFPDRLQNAWSQANEENFEELALALFQFQAKHTEVYKQYLYHLGCEPQGIKTLAEVPFLPIRFFKDQEVTAGAYTPEAVFESSGTTGQIPSRHQVFSIAHYHQVCLAGFLRHFGPPQGYHIFALLPSYLERNNASLVSMMDFLIQQSNSPLGGFYLNDLPTLIAQVEEARKTDRKVLIVGVTFALLDLAENYPQQWSDVEVLETGGMKGRRREMLRTELHEILREGLGVQNVLSEYGMTELMSQGYTGGGEEFFLPPWLHVRLRDLNDPFSPVPQGRAGGINVVDLANWHSCAFIETQDIGRYGSNGGFLVLGRFDHSDLRGCNLMVQ